MSVANEMDKIYDRMDVETINSMADSILNSLIKGGRLEGCDYAAIVDEAFDIAEAFMAESIRRFDENHTDRL